SLWPGHWWRRELQLAELTLVRPHLQIRRDAAGVVHVAGLALRPDAGATASPSDEPVLLDWLLSQSSIRIEGGALQWTDERRPAPTLGLANVDLHLQSGRGWRGRVHQISFAATPPASFGQRLSVSGRMTQPHWQWGPWQAEAGRQSTSMPASTPTPWWGFMPHA